jgi:hypothetical protein
MSAAAQTKIFGIKVGVDPKVIIGVLVVVAGLVFWYNSRSSEEGPSGVNLRQGVTAPAGLQPAHARTRRAHRGDVNTANRGTLRIKEVDASEGRIDPTLRLDMLQRLQSVPPAQPGRSLFEIGPSEEAAKAAAQPIHGPKIPINVPPPQVRPVVPSAPPAVMANIPLKFYGFVKPASKGEANRGLFTDGDNILVATEGQLLEGRYLVVELNQNSARMEDVQIRQGQTLPVVPEAIQQ